MATTPNVVHVICLIFAFLHLINGQTRSTTTIPGLSMLLITCDLLHATLWQRTSILCICLSALPSCVHAYASNFDIY